MQHTFNEHDVEITCTFLELVDMDSLAYAIYTTPTPQGEANQVYIGTKPHFRYDFLLANVEDFCQAAGWDSLGWEDMTEDEIEHQADDVIMITVPRTKQARM